MQKKFLLKLYATLASIALLIVFGFWKLPTQDLEVTMLDVKQGDAFLIKTPLHQKILIDGGKQGSILDPLSQKLGFFERKLQLVILTHPDFDHVGGLVEILKRYRVEKVLLSGIQSENEWYHEILREIAKQDIPVLVATSQSDFDFGGGVVWDTLYPFESLAGKTINANNSSSIVGKLTFGETSALFTGDLEKESEEELLSEHLDLSAQILKVSHHGSGGATGDEFLHAVNPSIALLSYGEDNSYGHPNPEVVAKLENAGVEILASAKMGNVSLVSDGAEWRVKY